MFHIAIVFFRFEVFGILDIGYWVSGVGYWMLDTWCLRFYPVSSNKQPASSRQASNFQYPVS